VLLFHTLGRNRSWSADSHPAIRRKTSRYDAANRSEYGRANDPIFARLRSIRRHEKNGRGASARSSDQSGNWNRYHTSKLARSDGTRSFCGGKTVVYGSYSGLGHPGPRPHFSSISEANMLRVEASNLTNQRGTPRPRRLLPHPAATKRSGASKARHEMLPPRDEDAVVTDDLTVPRLPQGHERWSVRLELADDEIAKLYGQGMTRGAVVWRKGMVEWRPLLITPELSGLLRRTRTTLTDMPVGAPLPWPSGPPLPRPGRLPSGIPAAALANAPVTPTTVAPIAMDVAEAPVRSRRTVEFAAVAAAAFALAWIAHGRMASHATNPNDAPPAVAAVASPAPTACEPNTVTAPSKGSSPGVSIPTVSVTDLPLASALTGASWSRSSGRATSRAAASNGSSPARADLVNALTQVAHAASGCGERGGPVRVVVSFANSGVARSIQVSGQDLPAATRSCIIGAASRARVPAFTGDPVTVAKSL
jgi:hypothetical protein